jgi:hypothetical protein
VDLAEVQAIIPRSETRVDSGFLEEISQEIKRITNLGGPGFRKAAEKLEPEVVRNPYVVRELKNLGSLIFSHLLPQAARDRLRSSESSNLYLRLDDQLVHIPWELAFDGQQFLGMKFRVGRQIITHHKVTQPAPARAVSDALKVLIVSDPSETLKNVTKECEQLCDVLDGITNLEVRFIGGRGVRRIPLLAALRESDIVHFAGHSQFDEKNPENSGWLLYDGLLSASEISKLDQTPLLVFSNSCQAAATKNWQGDYLFEGQAFGLGSAFLLAGVRNYVGTFCVVHDEESRFLAVEFYRRIARGLTIGEALLLARLATAEEMGLDRLTWASYMLYGDPEFSLTGLQRTAVPSSFVESAKPIEVAPTKRQFSENPSNIVVKEKSSVSVSYRVLAWLFGGLFTAVLAGLLLVMWWHPRVTTETSPLAKTEPGPPTSSHPATQTQTEPNPDAREKGLARPSAIPKAAREVSDLRFEVESLRVSINTNNVMMFLNITNKTRREIALALGVNPQSRVSLMDETGEQYVYRDSSGVRAWQGPYVGTNLSDWLVIPPSESRTVSITFASSSRVIIEPNSKFTFSAEFAAVPSDDLRRMPIQASILNLAIQDIGPQ